ncbi:DUF2752 domain-containing protein [Myroides sp. LJL119]
MRIFYLSIAIALVLGYTNLFVNNGVAVGCSFYEKTKLLCPGCGGQRAISSLLKGQIKQAIELNALIIVYLLILGYLYIALMEVFVVKNKEFQIKYGIPNWMSYLFIIIMFLFFIIRNL